MFSFAPASVFSALVDGRDVANAVKHALKLNEIEQFLVDVVDFFTHDSATHYLEERQWKKAAACLFAIADAPILKAKCGVDIISISTPEFGDLAIQDLNSTELMHENTRLRNEGLLTSGDSHIEGILITFSDGTTQIKLGTCVRSFQKKISQHIITNQELYLDNADRGSVEKFVQENAINNLIKIGNQEIADRRNDTVTLSYGETFSQLVLSIVKTPVNFVDNTEEKEVLANAGNLSVHIREMCKEERDLIGPIAKSVCIIAYGIQNEQMRGIDLADLKANLCKDVLEHPHMYTPELVQSPELVRFNCLARIERNQALSNDELKIVLRNCLERIGTDKVDQDDLTIFKVIFNLPDDAISLDALKGWTKLSLKTINHLVSMRADPVYDNQVWIADNTNHFLSILNFGLNDEVCQVYEIIFSSKTMKNCLESGEQLAITQIKSLTKYIGTGIGTALFTLSDNTVVGVKDSYKNDGPAYIEFKINGHKEKLDGIYQLVLSQQVQEDKVRNGKNYEKFRSQTKAEINAQLLKGARDWLVEISTGDDGEITHRKQMELDIPRSAGIYVQIDKPAVEKTDKFEGRNTPRAITELVDKNLSIKEYGFTEKESNIIKLMVDQRYRTNFAAAINQIALGIFGDWNCNSDHVKKYFHCTAVIPVDIDTTHTLNFYGRQVVGLRIIDWDGKLIFSDEFYGKLEDASIIESNDFGIKSLEFTKVELSQTIAELEELEKEESKIQLK